MTENGDPNENVLAERVNDIIKIEFNLYSSSLDFAQKVCPVSKSVKSYNELRPHASCCDYLTPNRAHLQAE
jgi:putative transposase